MAPLCEGGSGSSSNSSLEKHISTDSTPSLRQCTDVMAHRCEVDSDSSSESSSEEGRPTVSAMDRKRKKTVIDHIHEAISSREQNQKRSNLPVNRGVSDDILREIEQARLAVEAWDKPSFEGFIQRSASLGQTQSMFQRLKAVKDKDKRHKWDKRLEVVYRAALYIWLTFFDFWWSEEGQLGHANFATQVTQQTCVNGKKTFPWRVKKSTMVIRAPQFLVLHVVPLTHSLTGAHVSFRAS